MRYFTSITGILVFQSSVFRSTFHIAPLLPVKEQQQASATEMDVLCHHFPCQMMGRLASPVLSSTSSPPPKHFFGFFFYVFMPKQIGVRLCLVCFAFTFLLPSSSALLRPAPSVASCGPLIACKSKHCGYN